MATYLELVNKVIAESGKEQNELTEATCVTYAMRGKLCKCHVMSGSSITRKLQ
jgi:hypothetical protein